MHSKIGISNIDLSEVYRQRFIAMQASMIHPMIGFAPRYYATNGKWNAVFVSCPLRFRSSLLYWSISFLPRSSLSLALARSFTVVPSRGLNLPPFPNPHSNRHKSQVQPRTHRASCTVIILYAFSSCSIILQGRRDHAMRMTERKPNADCH